MKRLALIALMFLAFSANAIDLPPGKWWRRPEVIQVLGLTDEQQERLDAISLKAANELIDLKAEMEKSNVALRAELDQPQLNRDAIRKAAARLSESRSRLFERELMLLVDMRTVLTDAQWSKMRRKLDQMRPQQQGGPMQQQKPRPNFRRRQ